MQIYKLVFASTFCLAAAAHAVLPSFPIQFATRESGPAPTDRAPAPVASKPAGEAPAEEVGSEPADKTPAQECGSKPAEEAPAKKAGPEPTDQAPSLSVDPAPIGQAIIDLVERYGKEYKMRAETMQQLLDTIPQCGMRVSGALTSSYSIYCKPVSAPKAAVKLTSKAVNINSSLGF